MWLFDQNGFDNALRISHVIVAIMWMGLLWFFNFVQTPAYAEMEAAAAQQRVRQAHVARAVVVPLGRRRDRRRSACSIIAIARQGHVTASDFWKSHRAAPTLADRHPLRPHDAPQRVDGDLAEPADRHRQRPQRAGRRRGRTRTPRPRRAPARWRPARTRSSRCRCSSSWSARRTSTTSIHFGPDAGRRRSGSLYFLVGIAVHRGARAERARQDQRHAATPAST